MKPFHPGQQVKLTGNLQAALMKRPRKVDWSIRKGVVRHCSDHSVLVVWDGRTSADSLPVKAVELVSGVFTS